MKNSSKKKKKKRGSAILWQRAGVTARKSCDRGSLTDKRPRAIFMDYIVVLLTAAQVMKISIYFHKNLITTAEEDMAGLRPSPALAWTAVETHWLYIELSVPPKPIISPHWLQLEGLYVWAPCPGSPDPVVKYSSQLTNITFNALPL